jgi:hypothetical protein
MGCWMRRDSLLSVRWRWLWHAGVSGGEQLFKARIPLILLMGKRKAIWSLVWGILSVVIWPLSIIFGPIALAMGVDVLRKKEDARGMAIAGIVTGSIGLLIIVVFVLLAYFGALGPDFAQQTGPVIVTDTDRGSRERARLSEKCAKT